MNIKISTMWNMCVCYRFIGQHWTVWGVWDEGPVEKLLHTPCMPKDRALLSPITSMKTRGAATDWGTSIIRSVEPPLVLLSAPPPRSLHRRPQMPPQSSVVACRHQKMPTSLAYRGNSSCRASHQDVQNNCPKLHKHFPVFSSNVKKEF